MDLTPVFLFVIGMVLLVGGPAWFYYYQHKDWSDKQ